MNRFVDRDMFMRFRGGGIGHKAMWDALAKISKEFHNLFDDGDDEPIASGGNININEDEEDDDEGEDSQEEDDGDETDEDKAEDEVDGDELGPEDGEETWEDVQDAEGYAPL